VSWLNDQHEQISLHYSPFSGVYKKGSCTSLLNIDKYVRDKSLVEKSKGY
jgi:hypothetical protein